MITKQDNDAIQRNVVTRIPTIKEKRKAVDYLNSITEEEVRDCPFCGADWSDGWPLKCYCGAVFTMKEGVEHGQDN